MTTAVEVVDAIESLVSASCVGPAMAFFEVFGHRVVYKTFAYRAGTPDEALEAIKHIVINEINEVRTSQGLLNESHNVTLFWRKPQKVEVSCNGYPYVARTRVAVVSAE